MNKKQKISPVWYENHHQQLRYWSYDEVHDFLYYAISEVDKICKKHSFHYYLSSGTILGAVRHNDIIPWDPDADLYIPAQEMQDFVTIARKEFPDDLYIDYYDVNPSYLYTSPKIGRKGFTTNGLHMDIFPLVGLPRNDDKKKFLYKYEKSRIKFKICQNNWDSRLPKLKEFCENRFFRRICSHSRRFIDLDKTIKQMESLGSKYSIFSESEYVFDGYRIYPASVFTGSVKWLLHDAEYPIPVGYLQYLEQTYGNYLELPENRAFQQIIRYDTVTDSIKYKKTVFISSFITLDDKMLSLLEKLYRESGSIVAIVNNVDKSKNDREKSLLLAKSLRFFDKVLNNNENSSKEDDLINLVAPDNIIRF